jgi:hypothetical protein
MNFASFSTFFTFSYSYFFSILSSSVSLISLTVFREKTLPSLFSLSLEQFYNPLANDPNTAKLESRITVWKLVGGDENVSTVGQKQKSTFSRRKSSRK